MQDDMLIQDVAKINDIVNGTAQITDIVQVEDILLVIRQAEQEIEFFEALKKHRASVIDQRISERSEKIEKLREATKGFLLETGRKSVEFPDVAKISISKKKGTWVIEDEDKMLASLKGLNQYDKVVEETIKIKKKELNKVLDELEKNRNVPPGVSREDESNSIAISFSKTADQKVQSLPDLAPHTLPQKAQSFDMSKLDGL